MGQLLTPLLLMDLFRLLLLDSLVFHQAKDPAKSSGAKPAAAVASGEAGFSFSLLLDEASGSERASAPP